MAHVTDPLPVDRDGIDRAGLDTARRLQLSMSPRQSAGQVVVALSGEIDMADAACIAALVTAVAIRVRWLIVDLAGLEFTDCAGLRALAAAARQARQAGGGLVLTAPGPPVLRALDLTGLMTGVPVYSSLEEAAKVPSPQRAARPAREPDVRAIVAGLPLSGQDASRKKGSVGPHQQPMAGDAGPQSP
jgi:anti-sigma B factor antagonist